MSTQRGRRATAFAPATVANVACGFDVLGFALSQPGDTVTAELTETGAVEIHDIQGDDGRLPRSADRNTAGVVVRSLLDHLRSPLGITLTIFKGMPLGSGMGSSAASAAAALVAANELLGGPLSRRELVPFAIEGERAACGSGHADNVAPALLGNFTLIRSYDPLDIVSLPAPEDLHCVLIHPHIEIRTEDARRVLRKQVYLKDAITQWGNTAALVAGILLKDYALIGRSLTDVIVEPERSLLIPGFNAAKSAALRAGALGCSISGSGPAMFALCEGAGPTADVAAALKGSFEAVGIESKVFVSRVNTEGARLLEGL